MAEMTQRIPVETIRCLMPVPSQCQLEVSQKTITPVPAKNKHLPDTKKLTLEKMLRTITSRPSSLLLLLLALATTSSLVPMATGQAVTYTVGSTTVEISEEIIDANNSTKKCVEFTSGSPE